MKKYLAILLTCFLLQNSVSAQTDFVLNNPTMGPVTPAPFPGNVTISFDFYVAQSSFTFSSDPLSNNYATMTFSFTKLDPTGIAPSGTGAALFDWVLTNNGGAGVNRVYTYTGVTKNVTMNQSPPAAKYQITFPGVPVVFAATQAQSDVRVAGQFTDPGAAPAGLSANNSSSIATFTAAGGPVPVKLLSFNAVKQGTAVNLKWQTASEQNSNYFDVQFSENGTVWQSIGRVQAAGTSNIQQNYTLTHATPVKGINYYRLKQVDRDGNFVYSDTRVVNFNDKGLITVLPNPVADRLYITGNNGLFESVRLFNSEGKQLQQYSNFASGSSIDMNSYPAGMYIIKITEKDGNTVVNKIVKR